MNSAPFPFELRPLAWNLQPSLMLAPHFQSLLFETQPTAIVSDHLIHQISPRQFGEQAHQPVDCCEHEYHSGRLPNIPLFPRFTTPQLPPAHLRSTVDLSRLFSQPTPADHHAPFRVCHRAASAGSKQHRLPPRTGLRGGSPLFPRVADIYLEAVITFRAGHGTAAGAFFIYLPIEFL